MIWGSSLFIIII